MRKSVSGLKSSRFVFEDTTRIRVRYSETDAMGWVYYAEYFCYFEIGRTELIRRFWRSYRSLEEEGWKLPVVEAQCKYLHGARYDDTLLVITKLLLPSAFRLRFEYLIRREADARDLAVGFTEHCFVSDRGKPIRIPEELLNKVEP